MKRREFLTLLGGAAAWPLTARAQQPTMPVIGFLNFGWAAEWGPFTSAFHEGLKQLGYVEGRNVTVEYRWADGNYERLPSMARDLVERRVAVIAATGGEQTALAAKAATTTIPIVFSIGGDPVRLRLVSSLKQPDGNLTGVTQFTATLEPKRLELLRELIPNAPLIAVLVNPKYPGFNDQVSQVQAAAENARQRIVLLNASSESEIDRAFARMVQERASAVLVASDPFFTRQREQLVTLAGRHAIPAIYQWRQFLAIGGLMSYGTDLPTAYRQVGIYAGRLLKGAKPADLPVMQSVEVELVLNLKTAKTLGLTFPISLLGRADEVIE